MRRPPETNFIEQDTIGHAIIRDLNQAWTDRLRIEDDFAHDRWDSWEDRYNAHGYLDTAQRHIDAHRAQLDAHRAQLDAHRAQLDATEERVMRLTEAAVTIGDPATAAVAYLVYGPAAFPPAAPPARPAPAPAPQPLTAATLPKSEALAEQALADAENAFWDHAEDCGPCFTGANKPIVQGLCPRGWGWWRARNCAADTARNWREYDRWLRGGGNARHLANDWIA